MVLKQSQTPYKRKTDVFERSFNMIYSHEVEMMCPVAQGANHGPAPIPEEAKWVKAKEIKDIPVLHMVSAGVLHSRVHVNLL